MYRYIPITPVPAPRQSQSDAWKPRDCVVRYRAYKDALRPYFSKPLPDAFEVVFVLPMSKSWSQKQRKAMNGTRHQFKPDTDNLLKAFKDALCEKDERIFHERCWKFWGERGGIYYQGIEVGDVILEELIDAT